MTWTISEELERLGGCDDDERAEGVQSPDWQAVLVTKQYGRARHLFLQFPRPGIDRPAAEKIVTDVLKGLNGPTFEINQFREASRTARELEEAIMDECRKAGTAITREQAGNIAAIVRQVHQTAQTPGELRDATIAAAERIVGGDDKGGIEVGTGRHVPPHGTAARYAMDAEID